MVKRIFIIVPLLIMSFIMKGQYPDELIMAVEKAPIYNGDLMDFVNKHINYPQSAKIDSVEGTVFVEFFIDTAGNTFDHFIVKGIRDDLDNEALRVTRLIKFDFPAMQREKPITVMYIIPVKFELNSDTKRKCSGLGNARNQRATRFH